MNLNRIIIAALIVAISACATVEDSQHLSPSRKYAINFYEARGESDSYYQILNLEQPDITYSSIGGATPLNNHDIYWSPTEKTCAILENRPGSVGLQNGTGLIRILYIVSIKGDREYHQIYMRPFESQYFNGEKVKVSQISDKLVRFEGVDQQFSREFSIASLIDYSYQQGVKNFKDNEIQEAEPQR
jgi:hypothetical protein